MKQETFSFSTLYEENVTSLLRTKKNDQKNRSLYKPFALSSKISWKDSFACWTWKIVIRNDNMK